MRKLKKAGWWILAAAATSGCAPLGTGMYDPGPKPMVYAFNAVKRITPDITRDDDPITMQQTVYPVGPTDRLLMRFKDLLAHSPNVRIDETDRVQVQITLPGAGDTALLAVNDLEICPLTRDFFMMATWQGANPFSAAGRWQHEGGDYDETACAKGAVSKTDNKALLFDVTQWFIDYPRARNVNFGLILISDKPFEVAGNASGSAYPRLLWSE